MSDALDYALPKTVDQTAAWRPWWKSRGAHAVVGIGLLSLGLAGMWVLSRPMCTLHVWSRYNIRCSSNLREISLAMSLYADHHGGQYPDEIDGLLSTQFISPAEFVCPGSSDTPASGATPTLLRQNLLAGGHLSYVYCGRGQSSKSPAAVIFAFEDDFHHGSTGRPDVPPAQCGRNFLFADGHVAYLPYAAANHAINELAAGHNPPRP